jgi:hypothetical protein
MSWKDKLMLKMMSNKLVIKIFSIPIVVRMMMWMTQVAARRKGSQPEP